MGGGLWVPPNVERGKLASPDELDLWMGIAPFIGGGGHPIPAGYVARWDASQITGQADNTALSSWTDASGNGNTLTQATGANQPTYFKTTGAKLVNGLPAVWFSGTTSSMATSASIPGTLSTYTIMAIAKTTVTTGSPALFVSTAGNNVLFQNSGNHWRYFQGDANSVDVGTPDTNLHCFVVCISASSTTQLYVDGAGNSTGSNTSALTTAGLSNVSGNATWNGPICEVAIWSSFFNSTQAAAVRSYAQSRWGTP